MTPQNREIPRAYYLQAEYYSDKLAIPEESLNREFISAYVNLRASQELPYATYSDARIARISIGTIGLGDVVANKSGVVTRFTN